MHDEDETADDFTPETEAEPEAEQKAGPRGFKLSDKEREKLKKQIIALDTRIAEHLEDWWQMPAKVTAFMRGDHYQGEGTEEMKDAETTGDEKESGTGEKYPVIHFVWSRVKKLVANILREDDDPVVVSDDEATFYGLPDDHEWKAVADQYRKQFAPQRMPMAPQQMGQAMPMGQQVEPAPQPEMPPAQNQESDNEIAAKILNDRLSKYLKRSRMRKFWRKFLTYAAYHRNAAIVTHYDDSAYGCDPIKTELVPCGEWGYDPNNRGEVEDGEGVFYIAEMSDREFKDRYGRTPKQVEEDEEARGDEGISRSTRAMMAEQKDSQWGVKNHRRVKIFFMYDDAVESETLTETKKAIDLIIDGEPVKTWSDGETLEQVMAEIQAVAQGATLEQVGGATREREETIEVVGEDGKPETVETPKYTGGIKVVHFWRGVILKVEDNWNPRGRCPLQQLPWEEVAGQVLGVSAYDLGKDANQTMDRALYYFLAQAERSIGGAVADPSKIENWDEFVENAFGGITKTKEGAAPGDAVYYHQGIPVSPQVLTGMEIVRQAAEEGLGTDQQNYSQAQSVKDNAMAQEGLYSELQLTVEMMRESLFEFMQEHYMDVLAYAIEYEVEPYVARIEGEDGKKARIEYSMSALRFPEQEYDVQFSVNIQSRRNVPRNPIARAQYMIQSSRNFYEVLASSKDAARLMAETGDLPWPREKLLRLIDSYEPPQPGTDPTLQIKMQEIQLQTQRYQAELQMKMQQLQMDAQKQQADNAIKVQELQLQAQKMQVDSEAKVTQAQTEILKAQVERDQAQANMAIRVKELELQTQKLQVEHQKFTTEAQIKIASLRQKHSSEDADRALKEAELALEAKIEIAQSRPVRLGP